MVASGTGLLSTIIAVPIASDIQAWAIRCGLLGAEGKLIGRWLQQRLNTTIRSVFWQSRTLSQTIFRPISWWQDFWRRVSLDIVWSWQVQADERRISWPSETGRWSVRERQKAVKPTRERKGDGFSPQQALGSWRNWHFSMNVSCFHGARHNTKKIKFLPPPSSKHNEWMSAKDILFLDGISPQRKKDSIVKPRERRSDGFSPHQAIRIWIKLAPQHKCIMLPRGPGRTGRA